MIQSEIHYKSQQEGVVIIHITDTALIIEGGGMRGSYTAGILNNLIREKIYFDYVAGISAGASCAVNYISLDMNRLKASFVDIAKDKNTGGIKSFIRGRGYFNSKYIYEEMGLADGALPFDFNSFYGNRADFRIGAFNAITGNMRYFSKKDIQEDMDLMKIVRASSTMPGFMPITEIGQDKYVDGGLSGGIALDIAKREGYKKFFVIRTRPKDYRKTPPKNDRFVKKFFKRFPKVSEAILTRYIEYNRILDELEELENKNEAFIVYPKTMLVSNMELDAKKLNQNYEAAYSQGREEVERWKDYLKI